jgi:hypothetical protein
MVRISEARSVGLFRVRVNIGRSFGVEDEAEYIVLREPTNDERQQYLVGEQKDVENRAKGLLPKCIVESSFVDDDGKPASADDVAAFICDAGQSATRYAHVIKTWLEALPLESRKPGSSGR